MKKENLDRFEKASQNKKDSRNYMELSGFLSKKIVKNCGVDSAFEVLIKDENSEGVIVGLYSLDVKTHIITEIETDTKIFNSKIITGGNSDVLYVTNNIVMALNIIEDGRDAVCVGPENMEYFLEIIKKTKKFISPIAMFSDIQELEKKLKDVTVYKDRNDKTEEKLKVTGFTEAKNIVLSKYKEDKIPEGVYDKDVFHTALDSIDISCRGESAIGQRTLNKEYEKSILEGSGIPIATGIDILDIALGGGIFKGRLVILGGETGIGKTALVVNIMRNFAKRKIETHYIALEIEGLEMRNRTMALEMAYNYKDVAGATIDNLKSASELNNIEKIREFDEIEMDLYRETSEEYLNYANMQFVHSGGAVASTSTILSNEDVAGNLGITMEKIRNIIINRIKSGVPNLVLIVDYIQLIKSDKPEAVQQMDQITMFLKSLAIEFKICIIGLSSINKVSANKTVSNSVFKGSNSISYTADVALVLAYNLKEKDWPSGTKDEDAKNVAIIAASKKEVRDVICIVSKNRMGISGYNVPLAFYGKSGLLDNYIKVREMGFRIEDEDFKDAITLMQGIHGNTVTSTLPPTPTTPTSPNRKKSTYKTPPLNSNPWRK